MDGVGELLELEALRRLKARYFYLMDTKDWDAWLSLFTADATLEWGTGPAGGDGMVGHVGVAAIAEHVVRRILADRITIHHGHTPLLELVSESEARGIWAMEDTVVGGWRDASRVRPLSRHLP